MFLGRKEELNTLDLEYRRDNGFVVIYGRRRVGKTTLIKEFLKDKNSIYYLATEEIESQCMKRFGDVIARTTGNRYLQNASFNDWLDLFRIVTDYRSDEKKVLVIDEFPYLVKANPSFPSILQNAWDEILKDRNVMLILCGSLIGMMKKHALSYESPLYGRRTCQINLSPLHFTEVYAEQNISFENAAEQYSITGGVPKYFDFFDSERSLEDQIRINVLSKNGFLYEEPNFLLKSESVSSINYFSIIKTISDGNHKQGKIASALGEASSFLTPYLATLMELGFIEKRYPVTEMKPEKSKKGLYFISDNFIRFWFRYVYPYKGELELDNQQIVMEELSKDFETKFVASVYEDICKDIFSELCRNKKISFVPSKIGSYWLSDYEEDTEIDVVSIDRQNKRIFVGECKYHIQPVEASVYFDLKVKVSKTKEIIKNYFDYEIIYGVFSKSGFQERMIEIAKDNPSLYLINEDEIVA